MAIKLLPKNKISELKQKETSREIQEGAKLASRVDGLRELWAKTEQEFEIYKTATLTQIQEEIVVLNEKKSELDHDLRKMQAKYDSLMPDISTKRLELAQFERNLFLKESELQQREEEAALLEIDVAEALKKSETARIINEDNERISMNLLLETQKKRVEAQGYLNTAKNIYNNTNEEKKTIEDSLLLRELSIKTKEQEISNKELSIMNEQKELELEWIKVKDMRATLERSLQRIKEGRLA